MYDKDGEMVDSIMTQNGLRTNITYDQMPKNLVDAFVLYLFLQYRFIYSIIMILNNSSKSV